ncbi:polyamine-modulated factor 1-binding protein 1-like [Penaeus chinensis]|uniref:polyamine-modulated factor 1-binding protein 1-like n=1 Tax=Penaeus chinensis TaxID=139456 RepID=UPI001FB5B36E|nr:polyamine-modulated factor 1-binding protein 1-like [Penaeus chinensis]
MEDTLRRLEQEHRRAGADVQAAEGERAEARAALAEAKRALQSLQKRHSDEEARGRALQHELLQQHSSSERRRQMIASVSGSLAEEEAVRAAGADADSTTTSLDSVARMRMASYEMVQQKCLAKDRLHQQVLQARARVTALKSRLQAFRHSPGSVEPLKSQIRYLEEAVLSLRQQVSNPDDALQSLREQTKAAQQDVRAYRRRNEDHIAELKTALECAHAHNSRLNLELSRLEREVCRLRDRL